MKALEIRKDQTLTLGRFHFGKVGLSVNGQPSFIEWEECGRLLRQMEGAVQWWIGDWLNYGEPAYGEKYSQALETTDLDYDTLTGYSWVARSIEPCLRRQNLRYYVHKEIAAAPPDKRAELLEQAEKEQWSVATTRRAVRDLQRGLKSPQALAGEFQVLAADPPWAYSNSGFDQSAESHYPTLEFDAIAALPETDPSFPKAASDSVLFIWATSPLLPEAVAVMAAWGFAYKASLVWQKPKAPPIGWWVKTRHELLLIGLRGAFPHPAEKPDSIIDAAVSRHSQKPSEAYRIIEAMYPDASRVELFAREHRLGWAFWGNQV